MLFGASPLLRHAPFGAAALACLAALAPLAARGAAAEPRAPGLVDLHVDLSYRLNYRSSSFARGSGQFMADRLLESGVAGVVLPLYIPREVSPFGPRDADLESSYRSVLGAIAETPPYRTPGCAPAPGGVRTWLAFEGAAPLAFDAGGVRRWHERGVRVFGLVHTYDNALASSSGQRPAGEPPVGLTPAGRAVVREVFSFGAVVDVSHASDATTDEVLAMAREQGGVVIATHSNARALAPHPRNLTDAQLRGIAATGGVIGVNFHTPFLVAGRAATLVDVARHIEHVARVAGSEHVAVGSDFEGGIRPPRELRDVTGLRELGRLLERRGMPRRHVEQAFGLNALRVLCPR